MVEGSKVGLEEDLAEVLADPRYPDPLAIINGPLMAGMSEVGRLFNDNKLIVAEVLSVGRGDEGGGLLARAAHGEGRERLARQGASPRSRATSTTSARIWSTSCSNNGFAVVNLGIKVPSEQLIQAVSEHRLDVIGLPTAGEERTADGGHGGRSGGHRHRHAAAGRRCGAHPPLHPSAGSQPPATASAPTPAMRCTVSSWSSGCSIRRRGRRSRRRSGSSRAGRVRRRDRERSRGSGLDGAAVALVRRDLALPPRSRAPRRDARSRCDLVRSQSADALRQAPRPARCRQASDRRRGREVPQARGGRRRALALALARCGLGRSGASSGRGRGRPPGAARSGER
ncbi:MAG: B12-binding domain-containing protein [Thermoanaerobaculia bacterium]